MKSESESENAQPCPTLCDPWTAVHQALCPWDFPGKSTGVGCHFLLHVIYIASNNCKLPVIM